MSDEELKFIGYCCALLTILNESEISFIDSISITAHEMTFESVANDDYLFDSIPLCSKYTHSTKIHKGFCTFTIERDPATTGI
jgi:hypothetical protein